MRRPRHYLRHHEEILIEDGLKLLGPLHDGGVHVVRHSLLHYLQLAELETVGPEFLALRALVVDLGEEEPISVFVLVVLLVVLGEGGLGVPSEDVLCDLLEVGLEAVDEVLELMEFVGLEVELEEHVVRDDDGEGHPVERALLDAGLEEVGVVADLLESHEDVHHTSGFVVLLLAVLVPDDLVVKVLLAPAHAAADDGLGLLGQLRLDILLHPAQEEGPQHSVQLLQDLLTDREVLLQRLLEGDVEPLVEVVEGVEDLGHEKVKQRPQLGQVVLQGCAGEQQPAVGLEVEQDLPALRLEVLNVLSLVQDHVVPFLASEYRVVGHSDLVAGNADMETVEFRPALPLLLALFGRPEVGHDLEGRTPALELDLPVHQNGRGDYD